MYNNKKINYKCVKPLLKQTFLTYNKCNFLGNFLIPIFYKNRIIF